MDNIFIIVTGNNYPEGDAGAVREHSYASILKELGYTPLVIGMGATTDFEIDTYDGTAYYSLRYKNNSLFFKVLGRILYKSNLRKIIKKLNSQQIRGVMYVSGGKKALDYIKSFAKTNMIPLYHDSVEWYSPSEFKNGKRNFNYKQNNNLNQTYIDGNFKVFVISRYLEQHYAKRNIKTLRIPVIMDVQKITATKRTNKNFIKIVYAGSIGKKDYVFHFIEALSELKKEERSKIKMVIIGTSLEEYEKQYGEIPNDIKGINLFFIGRVNRSKVFNHLEEADFTMLLRPEHERYAKAGFPTKVVESLSSSTSVICNYSSDLELYLHDGKNAIIVEDCSVDSCVAGLRKAINLSEQELRNMQREARKTAEEYFDYHRYVQNVKAFIDGNNDYPKYHG